MGRPPAYIFVVRHGNRLDAADKQWHLTTPSPYDPPLTYGGWMQSKKLGARIASILREREADDAAADEAAGSDKEVKKQHRYRVIVHSSPYVRCVQTSVAISAGLAMNPSLLKPANGHDSLPPQSSRVGQTSFSSNPAPALVRPPLSTDLRSLQSSEQSIHIDKVILRLDAFLGEWQSPDYFEHITPPPRSSLMLMTAKAELLKKENYDLSPHFRTPNVPTTPSQLWNSPRLFSSPLASRVESAEALDPLTSPGDTEGRGKLDGAADRRAHRSATISEPQATRGYKAPVPPYAVSSAEHIPNGYVAHARDACVDVDYQWDSTQKDFGWGDGGILPEEWAAMHQRFRKGLKRMVEWYTTADSPGEMVTKTPATSPRPLKAVLATDPAASAVGDEDEMEIENVVILVSHGAGCNALVGGITNQPVLADVPMSSLTIAQRRPEYDNRTDIVDNRAVASLDDAFTRRRLSVPDLYELKLFANTDHLHSAASTPSVSRPSSSAGSNGRARFGSFTSALKEINLGAQYGQPSPINRSNSVNASLGSMRRSSHGPSLTMRSPLMSGNKKGGITVGSGVTSFTRPNRTGSVGLWEPRSDIKEEREEEDLPMTLNFSHENEETKPVENTAPKGELEQKNDDLPVLPLEIKEIEKPADDEVRSYSTLEETDTFDEEKLPGLWAGTGNGGLWGAPRPPGEAERLRDFTSQKRRWTVNEH